jgi:hypothetical protein
MEENRMTVREVLEITVRNLKSIAVPVELMETIGQAVLGSVRNIEACIEAMNGAGGGEKHEPEADAE